MYIDLSLPLAANADDDSGAQATEREASLMRLGHKGTHLDRLLRTTVPLDYVKSRALVVDVSEFSQRREIVPGDLPLPLIRAGDFVIFHTGAIQRHGYGSRAYLDEYFELSWEAIDALVERKIHFIGIDARGVRRNQEHRKADELCERSGIYVIENMDHTGQLPASEPFMVYSFCFDIGSSGLPCRVIAEIDVASSRGSRRLG